MDVTSIASGSSGNCFYVGSDETHILIDSGLSAKRIEVSLSQLNLKGSDIDGILVTHEHIDHISGLGVMARRYGMPIYTTKKTREAILQTKSVGKIEESLFNDITADKEFMIKDLTINPTTIWHDAADPLCYSVYHKGTKASIATDLGDYDDYILDKLRDSDILLIEANHDVKMLEVGPYPYHLKQRILGQRGHLSNERAGQLINALMHDNLAGIILGHLSKENNFEELAYETVKLELSAKNSKFPIKDIHLQVAKRDSLSQLITVNK